MFQTSFFNLPDILGQIHYCTTTFLLVVLRIPWMLLKALLFFILSDQVHSVFLTSLRLLELILVHFIPTHKLGKSEVAQVVHQTLPLLIHRTGDSVVFFSYLGLYRCFELSHNILPHAKTSQNTACYTKGYNKMQEEQVTH